MLRPFHVALAAAALLASGCSSDGPWVHAVERSDTVPQDSATPTSTPTTTGASVEGEGLSARELVEALASDELTGRNNQSPGSTAAQELIVEQISQFAQPLLPDGYLQPFTYGTNILGLIPGGDLADEYIVIGAHYDHVGSECPSDDPVDHICNGATDNATGVATVISIARAIAAEGTPRRSVVIALWDAEEDGLLGSAAYVASPVVPLAQTVAYLNFDIQGATLLRSSANATFAIGAETGGDTLVQATASAMAASKLQPVMLSSFLFQGRSDHANFAQAGVPAILFSDATGGCYHTAQDEADIVDFAKLDQQAGVGAAIVRELAATDTPPEFTVAPNIVFADAVSLLALAELIELDFGMLSPGATAQVTEFAELLRSIVGAGAAAFDDAAAASVIDGVDQFVHSLTEGPCQSFTP
ncbi:MAG: M28 family peptidase [Ilumatobacteraceae bacterium]